MILLIFSSFLSYCFERYPYKIIYIIEEILILVLSIVSKFDRTFIALRTKYEQEYIIVTKEY